MQPRFRLQVITTQTALLLVLEELRAREESATRWRRPLGAGGGAAHGLCAGVVDVG
jgi:hypothetical protein